MAFPVSSALTYKSLMQILTKIQNWEFHKRRINIIKNHKNCPSWCMERWDAYWVLIPKFSCLAEYRDMTRTSCELMWINHFLEELKFVVKVPMTLHCDNQAAIHIASNLMFHEWTKHIEVDSHITRQKVEDGVIATPYDYTRVQIADMFTKALCNDSFGFIM